MRRFITRAEANTATKLFLSAGEPWHIECLSTYSDAFKAKKSELLREIVQGAGLTDQQQIEKTARLSAACIVGWHLPEEYGTYSPENAEALLLTYPELLSLVDNYSSTAGNFLEKK